MKNIRRIFYSIIIIIISSIVLTQNSVYAVLQYTLHTYTPLYYISIIVVMTIVTGISILILRKIYKDNKLEKSTDEEKRGDETQI